MHFWAGGIVFAVVVRVAHHELAHVLRPLIHNPDIRSIVVYGAAGAIAAGVTVLVKRVAR